MTRRLASCTLAFAALLLGGASAAEAAPDAGGLSSDNVSFVRNFPQHSDTSGARLLGRYFYITTERDLTIYDLGPDRVNAENPVQTDSITFTAPGMPVFTEEDPDTNGKILLTWNNNALQVFDVSDTSDIKALSTVAGTTDFGLRREQHTISCVLDCTYAYGSEGAIVDLRDPTKPKIVGNWLTGLPAVAPGQVANGSNASTHDVTEVAPGIVLTSTEPMRLLDLRTNPAAPTEIGRTAMPGFTHANLWPREMKDRFLLVGGEAANNGCATDVSATFQTYDTTGYQTTGKFTPVDQYRVLPGNTINGRQPDSTYCVHWFTEHPNFHDGGLVAISWYEQGTRFLRVAPDGKISEVGWHLPAGGQASAAYWVSDSVVYVPDYLRGLDILKFTGDTRNGTTSETGTTGTTATTGEVDGTGQAGSGGDGGQGTPGQQEDQGQAGAQREPGMAGLLPITGVGAAGMGGGPPSRRSGKLSFNQLVIMPSRRRCSSKASFTPRLRRNVKDPVRFVRVRINGRTVVKAGRRKIAKSLRLARKLGRSRRVTVRLDLRLRSGARVAGTRIYPGCRTRQGRRRAISPRGR